MQKELACEIIDCLPKERTLFEYFKDRYASLILSYIVGEEGKKVADIKQTAYGRLLEKPLVKDFLARYGQGKLTQEMLNLVWTEPFFKFLLGIDLWGDKKARHYYQTSRPGYNLVLQLNFSNLHDKVFRKLVEPWREGIFNTNVHPVMQGNEPRFRETLAWARIDLDFEQDQALIEEIQSDWVKNSQNTLHRVVDNWKAGEFYFEYGIDGDPENVMTYVNNVLKPYVDIWDEAMITAAIQFIRQELGIHTIFYHSYETGCQVKHCEPPMSLYTRLPKKFCFEKTQETPAFLVNNHFFQKSVRKVKNPYWYKLHLS